MAQSNYANIEMDNAAFEQIDLARKHLAQDAARAQVHATLANAFATLAMTYSTRHKLESIREELVQ